MDRCVSLFVRYGWRSLCIEQYLQHVAMTTGGSIVHRGAALLVPECPKGEGPQRGITGEGDHRGRGKRGGRGHRGRGNSRGSIKSHTGAKMATSMLDQRVPVAGLMHTLQNHLQPIMKAPR